MRVLVLIPVLLRVLLLVLVLVCVKRNELCKTNDLSSSPVVAFCEKEWGADNTREESNLMAMV